MHNNIKPLTTLHQWIYLRFTCLPRSLDQGLGQHPAVTKGWHHVAHWPLPDPLSKGYLRNQKNQQFHTRFPKIFRDLALNNQRLKISGDNWDMIHRWIMDGSGIPQCWTPSPNDIEGLPGVRSPMPIAILESKNWYSHVVADCASIRRLWAFFLRGLGGKVHDSTISFVLDERIGWT